MVWKFVCLLNWSQFVLYEGLFLGPFLNVFFLLSTSELVIVHFSIFEFLFEEVYVIYFQLFKKDSRSWNVYCLWCVYFERSLGNWKYIFLEKESRIDWRSTIDWKIYETCYMEGVWKVGCNKYSLTKKSF